MDWLNNFLISLNEAAEGGFAVLAVLAMLLGLATLYILARSLNSQSKERTDASSVLREKDKAIVEFMTGSVVALTQINSRMSDHAARDEEVQAEIDSHLSDISNQIVTLSAELAESISAQLNEHREFMEATIDELIRPLRTLFADDPSLDAILDKLAIEIAVRLSHELMNQENKDVD